VCDASQPPRMQVRGILNARSQRSYVTTCVEEALTEKRSHSESIVIKTFGSEWEQHRVCDIVHLRVVTIDAEPLILTHGGASIHL